MRVLLGYLGEKEYESHKMGREAAEDAMKYSADWVTDGSPVGALTTFAISGDPAEADSVMALKNAASLLGKVQLKMTNGGTWKLSGEASATAVNVMDGGAAPPAPLSAASPTVPAVTAAVAEVPWAADKFEVHDIPQSAITLGVEKGVNALKGLVASGGVDGNELIEKHFNTATEEKLRTETSSTKRGFYRFYLGIVTGMISSIQTIFREHVGGAAMRKGGTAEANSPGNMLKVQGQLANLWYNYSLTRHMMNLHSA